MTPDQIAELKRIAEAATANLAEHVQIKWAVPRKAMKPGVPLCHAIPADMLGDAAAVIVLQAARIEALEGALEVFARYGLLAGTDLDDETVIRLTYDDPEWGDDTVIGEVFLRPFRRAANLLGDRHG